MAPGYTGNVHFIIITDLDGTLLDHQDYSYADAMPAIRILQEARVPLILCSSKTAAEMAALREELGIDDPFIVENGGAIYFPHDLFQDESYAIEDANDFERIVLGLPYRRLKQSLRQIARELGLEVRLFEQFNELELEQQVGLSGVAAERALKREFDVPFQILGNSQPDLLEKELARKGLHLSRGGRFFHVTGDNDKGKAAKVLAQLYRQLTKDDVRMVGLGDSENDRSLLEVVDYPILIPNPASSSPVELAHPALRRAPEPGPVGWNQAVQDLLNELGIGLC